MLAATPVEPVQFASCQTGVVHQPTTYQASDGGGLPEDLVDLNMDFVPSPQYIELVKRLLSPGESLHVGFRLVLGCDRCKGCVYSSSVAPRPWSLWCKSE